MIRYPGPDGKFRTGDDLFTINDLHFVKDQKTLIHLMAKDVLHSFFLPQLRIKQDAVPGLKISVWFDADQAGQYDLVCAELCGWGHSRMRGNVTVHETQAEFDDWMKTAAREQGRDQVALDHTKVNKPGENGDRLRRAAEVPVPILAGPKAGKWGQAPAEYSRSQSPIFLTDRAFEWPCQVALADAPEGR